MSDERLVDEAAAWLFALMEDTRSPGDYIDWARSLLAATPRDEPHCGDCTNVPATCSRCLTDDYRGAAIALLAALRPAIERETLERAAAACDDQLVAFGSDEYSTGQPMSSFAERFACGQCAARIRALILEETSDG